MNPPSLPRVRVRPARTIRPRSFAARIALGAGVFLIAAALIAPGAAAQTPASRPLALRGFNQDVIADGVFSGASSVQGSTSTSIDTDFALYAAGFNPGFPAVGLPAGNAFTSASNPSVTFFIQGAAGANALLLTDQASGTGAGRLSLLNPNRFSSLAILVTGLESSNPVGYRLEFADEGKPTEGSFVAADNLVGRDPVALGGFGRVNRRTGQFDDNGPAAGNPRLFEVDLPLTTADAARTLVSIRFANLSPGPANGGLQRRVAIFAVSAFSSAQTVLQPLTLSGFNQDVIAEGAAGSTTTVAPDGAFVYYAAGFNPRFPAVGLPPGGRTFLSAANPAVNFALAPAAGPNALLLTDPARGAPTGTLTLAAPGRFTALAALVTGFNGNLPGAYRLNFADNGPATAGGFTAPDNFLAGVQAALAGFGRVERGSGVFDDRSQAAGNPRLFELDIPLSAADAARPLAGITFSNASTATSSSPGQPQNLAVFGVSGILLPAPAGAAAFTDATFGVREDAGGATISVTRTGGSAGAARVNFSTRDRTARAGVDYTGARGTLSWAPGESGVKTFTVPILNRPQTPGEATFLVNLDQAPGDVRVKAPSQAVVSILDGTITTDPVRDIKILSPPPGLRIVQNQAVEIRFSVDATIGGLGQVEFLVRDDNGPPEGQVTQSLGIVGTARDVTRWAPPGPGEFTLLVTATGVNGRTLTRTRPITVVPAAPTDTGPRVELLGNLEGQQFAAGSTITLVASAVDAAGNPLRSVQFYLDGEPLGPPVAPVVRRARHQPAPGSRGPLTRDELPVIATAQLTTAIERALQLINAQGTDANGVSGVSEGAEVFTRAEDVVSGLSCAITAPAEGSTLPANSAGIIASVAAADPAAVVRRVELFVDGIKVGERAEAPFDFELPPLAVGSHVLTATATNGAELNKAATPVNILAAVPTPPAVSLSVSGDGTTREGTGKAKVIFTRAGGSGGLAAALPVVFKLKGTAVNGVDYKPVASTTGIVIPAGSASVSLKIKPIDDAVPKGTRTAVVQLKPPADGSYTVGAVKKATVQIFDNE